MAKSKINGFVLGQRVETNELYRRSLMSIRAERDYLNGIIDGIGDYGEFKESIIIIETPNGELIPLRESYLQAAEIPKNARGEELSDLTVEKLFGERK